MSFFKSGWYLIYTRPLHERKVATELVKKSVNFFLATTKVLRLWHDRKKLIEAPLFPSYIFVFLKDHVDYYASLDIEGVVKYVKFGNEIAKVHEKIVSHLQYILNIGTGIEVLESNFDIGQHVRITQGSLTGLDCEIAEYKNEKKVLVRVNLLNRIVLATVPSLNLVQC